MRLRGGCDVPSAGILTLHHLPVEQLFTSGSGTSYAAPMVAFKAGQILSILPDASANLLRALLIGAADLPSETIASLATLPPESVSEICGHGYINLERAAHSDDSRVVSYAEGELPLDHFAVYEVTVPKIFQTEKGRRQIKVTLAFDPPVRHTRADYAGVSMGFRLVRGCTSEHIFEHYRRRTKEEGAFPELANRYSCDLKPGPVAREVGTIQTATAVFKRDVGEYGEPYFLVIRCVAGWAHEAVTHQRFAVVVELSHEADIQLYARMQVKVQA
jgi:hypothetical protein